MRIATFNINNVNRRLATLIAWLNKTQPDVACLQELKAEHAEFPVGPLQDAGYEAQRREQKSLNVIAVLSTGEKAVLTADRLPGDLSDL